MLQQSHELFWFFNEAEAAMGSSSGWSSFEYCMNRGTGQGESFSCNPEEKFNDKSIDAATRYKKIEKKFFKLNKRQRYLLQLYGTYSRRHWSVDPKLTLVFDDVLNLLLLDYSPDQLLDIVSKKSKDKVTELKLQYRKEINECLSIYQKNI